MADYERMAREMNNAYQGRTTSTFNYGEHTNRLQSFADNREKPDACGEQPNDAMVDAKVARMGIR